MRLEAHTRRGVITNKPTLICWFDVLGMICEVFVLGTTPMVYCLLPDKSRDAYVHAFNLIKREVAALQSDLNPQTALSDFELSIIQACVFPLQLPKRCYFHFCRCLIQKLQTLGLQQAYQDDLNFRRLFHKTAVLVFIPLQYVWLAWQAQAAAPSSARVDENIHYFESMWLVGNYPPTLWNVHAEVWTNSHVKAWHNKLKKVYFARPTQMYLSWWKFSKVTIN